MEELKPKYSLLTAICLVVGIVVGTGVFFKASTVLSEVDGNLTLAILAWTIGGIIMLISGINFANISLTYGNIHSMADFAKVTVGKRYGFIVGIFAKYIYFPAMTSMVAFVVGMYFCEVCGLTGGAFPFNMYVFLFAFIFLVILTLVNLLAPLIASKIQISTTVIKLIPLLLMGLVGVIIGLINNTLEQNFASGSLSNTGNGFFAAICVTAFSYEGWICATNIGGEIISGAILTENLLGQASSSEGVKQAFANLFGSSIAKILIVIVLISAIGTLNGLIMGNSRTSYALAINEHGLWPHKMKAVNKANVPLFSTIMGFILASLWLLYYYFSQTNSLANGTGFPFDSSELPIITTYLLYIPIYICFARKNAKLSFMKRFILPLGGLISALIMIVAACYRHKIAVLYYMIFFGLVIGLAYLINYLYHKRKGVA